MAESSDPSSAPRRPGTRGAVALAVLAVVLVRALVAGSRLDELELERYSANVGWFLLHGLPLDPEALPIIPHLRGSFVFGVLAVPFLWAFGPVLVALKALAITWSALGAGFLAAALGRLHGPRGALLGGLLLALAPPTFQMVDVLALGSHADTVPFLTAGLWLLVGPAIGPRGATRRGGYLALGSLLGAGLFFSMQLLVAAPALLLAWFVRDPRFWRRPAALLGALAALPWLALVPVVTRSATLVNKPLEERLLDGGVGELARKFGRGLLVELPASWQFAPLGAGWAGWVLGLALLAAATLAAARLPWRRLAARVEHGARPAALLFALAHPVLLLAAYAASDFQLNLEAWEDGMGSRYFMPLVPALLVLLVSALEALRARSVPGARVATTALLVAGAAGVAPLLDPALGLRQPPVSALELDSFADHLPHAAGDDLAARLALLDRLDPSWGTWRALAHRTTFRPAGPLGPERVAGLLAAPSQVPARLRPYLFAALGAVTADLYYDRFAVGELGALAQAEQEPILATRMAEFAAEALSHGHGEARRWFLRGFGRQLTGVQMAQILRALRAGEGSAELGARIGFRVLRSLPAEARADAVEGMGFQFGLRLTRYERAPRAVLAAVDELPPAARGRWARAAGRGFRMRFVEGRFDPRAPLSIRAVWPEALRPAFDAGLDPANDPSVTPTPSGADDGQGPSGTARR